MRRVTLAVALALACACGGGGSGRSAGSTVGGTPGVVFSAQEDNPGPVSAALASGPSQSDTITIELNLVAVSGLRAAGFDVLFDPSAVEYLGWTAGNAFESSNQTPLYVVGSNTPGVLTVGVNMLGPGSVDVNGTRSLIGMTFRVNRTGVFSLTFQSEALRNTGLQTIPATWYAGTLIAN